MSDIHFNDKLCIANQSIMFVTSITIDQIIIFENHDIFVWNYNANKKNASKYNFFIIQQALKTIIAILCYILLYLQIKN